MNESLSDSRPTGLELEPWTKSRPVSILLPDDRTNVIACLELVAVSLLLSLAAYRLALAGIAFAFIGAVICAGFLAGPIQVLASRSNRVTRLELGWKEIRFYRGGTVVSSLGYEEIASVQIRRDHPENWLSVKTLNGTALSFPCMQGDWVRFRQEILLVSNLGPRLAPRTEFDRGKRPVTPMFAEIFDHFYRVPLVEMQPGLSYRNKYPLELVKLLVKPYGVLDWLTYAVPATVSMLMEVRLIWSLPAQITFWSLIGLLYTNKTRLVKSLGDRFRIVPEGLEVTRGRKVWVVPLQNSGGLLKRRIRFQHGYFVRYGSGRKATYLDRRFIEPCPALPPEIGDNQGGPG